MSSQPSDPGAQGKINPCADRIIFREFQLRSHRIRAARPFNQALSDGGGQPIRVVVDAEDKKYVIQGNHRVWGAQQDGVREIEAILYTPQQWEEFIGWPFEAWGTEDPEILP